MSNTTTPGYVVTLACGHTFRSKIAPPSTGEIVYCRIDHKYSAVLYRASDWRIKCVDCQYGRYMGADKSWARRSANRHAIRYPGHRLKLFRANRPETWELIRTDDVKLPIGGDDGPGY